MFAPLIAPVARTFGFLEEKETVGFLVKDILGANLPKTLAVRNKDERIEVGFVQFGATAGYVALGLAVERICSGLLNLAERSGAKATKQTVQYKAWGKSAGIYPLMAGLFFAMPYLRNLLTAHRTHKVAFTDVVGETNKENTPEEEAKFKARVKHDKRIAGLTGAVSGGLAAIGVGLAALGLRRGIKLSPAWVERLNKLSLPGGKFMDYPDLAQMFGLIVPIYTAALMSARDKFEIKEQVLSFATFMGFFFGPQPLIRKAFRGAYERAAETPAAFKKLMTHATTGKELKRVLYSQINEVFKRKPTTQKNLSRLYATENFVGMATSIILLGFAPSLINIFLTGKRVDKVKAEQQPLQFQTFLDGVQAQRLLQQTQGT